jgi:hypothetical protein
VRIDPIHHHVTDTTVAHPGKPGHPPSDRSDTALTTLATTPRPLTMALLQVSPFSRPHRKAPGGKSRPARETMCTIVCMRFTGAFLVAKRGCAPSCASMNGVDAMHRRRRGMERRISAPEQVFPVMTCVDDRCVPLARTRTRCWREGDTGPSLILDRWSQDEILHDIRSRQHQQPNSARTDQQKGLPSTPQSRKVTGLNHPKRPTAQSEASRLARALPGSSSSGTAVSSSTAHRRDPRSAS